jgi:3-oxoacyl-[acyl-carrier protein] reductase
MQQALDHRPIKDAPKGGNRFLGKRVLITGASRGLGQSCAVAFAEEGAKVLLTARTKGRLEEIQGSLENPKDHRIHAGDLTEPNGVKGLFESIQAFGEMDILLHVMGGGLGMRDPLLKSGEFNTLFQTNLGAAAELNREIVPGMISRKKGNVIHVGSIASTEAVGSVGYNSVKAALAAYVRSLGKELAPTGVVITGILPGGFWAPDNCMVRLKERKPEVLERLIAERQPRARMGIPEEIIPLIFLLSSQNAAMMTGCCVPIDGGEGITYV